MRNLPISILFSFVQTVTSIFFTFVFNSKVGLASLQDSELTFKQAANEVAGTGETLNGGTSLFGNDRPNLLTKSKIHCSFKMWDI